jgi:rod shape-determining protein MreB
MLLKRLRSWLSEDLSIDLGTVNCLVSGRSNILLNEPTMVAQSIGSPKKVVAVGLEAKPMLGRTPNNIQIIQPLKDGVIADLDATVVMLQYFVHKVSKNHRFLKVSPRILVCVPCGATPVERRLIRDSVLKAGAREGYLIDEPMAAAIGAGLPVDKPGGSMVIDIGGGTTEVAVISLRGIVCAQSIPVAGNRFDQSIAKYVRNQYGILIGDATVERIKHEVATAFATDEVLEIEVCGLHIAEGIPKYFKLTGSEILDVLQEPLSEIMQGILSVLRDTPPELAGDIADRGIMLTGGGALLRNLDRLIQAETGIKVMIAEDPLTCVARGGGHALALMDKAGHDLFLMKE